MNLKGTPFYVSNTNTLVGVGCNITALLTNVKPNIVGCKSSCSKNYHTLTKDYLAVVACNRNRKNCGFHETGRCDGIRCCKTDMPEVIQQIVDVRIDSTTTTGDCKVAFITDDAYFLSNRSDPQRLHAKRYSTVELGWFIHTANRSFVKSLECSNIKYYDSRAKVSDFGTSRSVTVDHTHLTTVVSGTVGYVDPEYFQSSQLTDKSDVYSFGVVLVELITGEKSISFFRSQENRTLATYFIMAMKENKLFDIIDTQIKDGCMLNQVTATAKFARKCLNLKGRKRPSMREVSMELENIRSSLGDMQQHEHVSENEEEEEKDKRVVEDIIGEESRNDVVVTAPASQYNIAAASSSSWSDVEPLFPFQTR